MACENDSERGSLVLDLVRAAALGRPEVSSRKMASRDAGLVLLDKDSLVIDRVRVERSGLRDWVLLLVVVSEGYNARLLVVLRLRV
jgi:hypothetical protein